jgi:hypothetical protein
MPPRHAGPAMLPTSRSEEEERSGQGDRLG